MVALEYELTMTKRLELSNSHHLLWDKLLDDRAVAEAREARALAAMLQELGGQLNEPWQFDRVHRVFWMNIPDNPLEVHGDPAKSDAGTTVAR